MLFNVILLFASFMVMEAVAWFTHKYIMHGLLWSLHKDHHKKGEEGVMERNDSFFLFFALPAIVLFYIGFKDGINSPLCWIAGGITLYGFTYFVVHDVFIHQRIKIFKKTNHPYLLAIRRAHKMHHKNPKKEHGTCFGMLLVPSKYYRD